MSWLDREVITAPFRYALCQTAEEYEEKLREVGIPEREWMPFQDHGLSNAETHFYSLPTGVFCFVCMPVPAPEKGLLPAQIYGLLIHEAVHLKQRMMQAIGEETPSTEFEAYTVQRMAQELIHEWVERS